MRRLRRWLPRSLLARTVTITVAPLILTQLITGYIFFERHWDGITRQLAEALAGDIAMVVQAIDHTTLEPSTAFLESAQKNFKITIEKTTSTTLPTDDRVNRFKSRSILGEYLDDNFWKNFLIDALVRQIPHPFSVNVSRHAIAIQVKTRHGVWLFETSRRRVFERTTYIYFWWTLGCTLLFLTVALMFMRNQIRPIKRLAQAADAYGRGDVETTIKPEGATEVRRAALAFLAMRQRIQRQLEQRTAMLSGVSHDLRTPLTRMRLQLAMMADEDAVVRLEHDVHDMEEMIEAYLNYIKLGENEAFQELLLSDVFRTLMSKIPDSNRISLAILGDGWLRIQHDALVRCLLNLVQNALKYGEKVWITATCEASLCTILIDDDGPGIDPSLRAKVFAPFVRLNESRNQDIPGTGLGLTIARDVALAHDGTIVLDDSPYGGLRVQLSLSMNHGHETSS